MRRDAIAFLCIFLCVFAASACAGETRITGIVEGIVDDAPVDEAALERERVRIRAELAALSRRVADGYIAEQPIGEKRDQITLIVGALYETGRLGEAGSVQAMVALGNIYADGMNVDPDPDKTLGYFLKAGERGDSAAVDRLAPVMLRAKEWEAAKPGREGKSGFPTTPEELYKPELIQAFIDRAFALDQRASHISVEINRRILQAQRRR